MISTGGTTTLGLYDFKAGLDEFGKTDYWVSKANGYPINQRVMLDNGDIVKSTINGNTTNPNVDMSGWINALDASFVTYNGQTQKKINDGLESVGEMLAIQSPSDGMSVFVKSYISGLNKGCGIYTYDATKSDINDGVLCIGGWCLVSEPNIFSGGVRADGSDDSIALQRTYDALHSLGMEIDLLGQTIKTISLDIDSNSVIKNGTLDVYEWDGSVDFPDNYPESNWRRTPIMLKNNPRSSPEDFEYAHHYTTVVTTKNITFRNLKFKAKRRLFTAYKIDDLLIEGCDFEWESGEIINIIGGYQSTSFIDDTDTTTHILTPVNGYCENITFNNNKFTCLTPTVLSSATHFVANRNVTVSNNRYYNVPLGSRVDIWNTQANVFGNEYLFTDAAALEYHDTDPASIDSDYIGVYVGQNTHNVNIYNNVFDGVYRPIYVEVGSHVDIWGNNFKNRIGKRWWSYAIVLQGNFRDFDNLFWGNSSYITVRGNKFDGFGTAVANSTLPPNGMVYGHRDIIVKDNIVLGHSGHPSLLLNKTLNLTCINNKVDGYISVSNIGGLQVVSNNDVNHQSTDANTYPLMIAETKSAFFDASKNTLRSSVGACIRLVNTTASSINLSGCLLTPNLTNNFLSISNIGAVCGTVSSSYVTSFTRTFLVSLADGAVGTYTVSIPNIRPNDILTVHLQSANDLWTSSGIALDFKCEPKTGDVSIFIKNISGKSISFSPVFFIHFQVSMTPL